MIIVTGGAGFIGSNLILGLNRLGRTDIVVVDNLKNATKHRNLNRARFADIVAKEDLFEALGSMTDVELIFHQGACADTTEAYGQYMMKNNYDYSKRLLQFAEGCNARFIYASSAAVYGSGTNGFREELSCEDPLNIYGFSKLAFDNYVRQRVDRSQCQIVGLRYFNVYGPQENHKARMASVAMHLFEQLQTHGRMKLFEGSSNFKRDFVHVDDVVAVNLFFMTSNVSGIFNCGSGQARAFTDIALTLRGVHGSGEIDHVPFPDDLAGKYQRFTEADLGRLRAAGYQRDFQSLEAGVTAYYEALRQSGGYR
jgi:ADP-L-glycero-D-manno-heptose 6-epimerase